MPDNLNYIHSEEKKRTIEALQLIAGFNQHSLTSRKKDKLDEWICENDFNMQLFEILTDPDYKNVLKEVAKSIPKKA